MVKNPPTNAGDTGDVVSNLGSGRSPWRRKWQPTPVFFPGKSLNRGWAIVHGVAQNMT